MTAALSISPFAAQLLQGPVRAGTAIGSGYMRFAEQVLALTRPGGHRMPNGIESDLVLTADEPVTIGDGHLRTTTAAVTAGPLWDPRPQPRVRLSLSPRLTISVDILAGRGPGLTPLGDDILVGYLAGSALAGGDPALLGARAEQAARCTTALSQTLLRLAARGQLPEAAHLLLEHGDPEPLLRFGATSGKGIAAGLALATHACTRAGHSQTIRLTLPLQPAAPQFVLAIQREDDPCW